MTAEKPMNEFPVMDTSDGIVLFHPNIPAKAAFNVSEVLNTRWIGQGPRVDELSNVSSRNLPLLAKALRLAQELTPYICRIYWLALKKETR